MRRLDRVSRAQRFCFSRRGARRRNADSGGANYFRRRDCARAIFYSASHVDAKRDYNAHLPLFADADAHRRAREQYASALAHADARAVQRAAFDRAAERDDL